jgi:hypothetical protein
MSVPEDTHLSGVPELKRILELLRKSWHLWAALLVAALLLMLLYFLARPASISPYLYSPL